MNGLTKIVNTGKGKEKTKLRCKNGHTWKGVIYTSSALSYVPPLCPKCLKKGIKAVGKPVPIVPFRTRVKNVAKALTITPLKYLVAKPVCFAAKYLVAKPVCFTAKYGVAWPVVNGVKVGWFMTKLGAWTTFMPFKLTWAIGSFPFRLAGAILHRIANPAPQVVMIQDSGMAGFVRDSEATFGAGQPVGEPGFEAEEDDSEYVDCCDHCGESLCDCGACHECEDEDEEPGFMAEGVAEIGRNGFAPETTGRSGFAPEPVVETRRSGFAPETRRGGFIR